MTLKRLTVSAPLFAFFLFGSTLARVAGAQATGVTNSTSVPIPSVGHDYIGALNEVTDPANGSVSLRLAAPTPPGRRITLPFSFNYDTQGVYAVDPLNGIGLGNKSRVPSYLNLNGWSYSIPKLTIQKNTYLVHNGLGQSTCYAYNNFTLLDSMGVSRIFPIQSVLQKPYCAGRREILTGGDVSFIASVPSGSGVGAGTLVAGADGTTYSWQGSVSHEEGLGCDAACYYDYLVTKIEDRNGNQITLADLNNGAFSATDTVGRQLLSSSGFGVSGNTVTVSGLGGPYTVTWATVSHNFPMTWTVLSAPPPPAVGCAQAPTGSEGSSSGITAITLPNGKQYKLAYDPAYGLLSKLTYPSGGWIEYTWGLNSQSATAWLANAQGVANQCLWRFDKPALAHRYVSYDGTHIALQQDFSYSTTWNTTDFGQFWASKQTTVTTHDVVRGTSFVTTYVYVVGQPAEPFNSGPNTQFVDNELPVEQTITYKDTNGATLQTVTKVWINTEQLASEQTVLDSGQTSKVAYTYGLGGQVTEKDEYDYGQTSPTRKTVTNFQVFPSTPLFPSAPSIFDKPCQRIVYNSGGTESAETDYLYDGGAAVCGTPGTTSVGAVSGLPTGTHDETNYGASSTVPRGNATSSIRNCTPSCTSAVTTFTYDETGQTLSSTDPCGNSACSDVSGTHHQTLFSYADNYSIGTPPGNTNAFLTQVTKPATLGANHILEYSYSYADGKLTVAKDENLQPTSYAYNDALDRLTQVNYPDGGQITYTYNDAVPSFTTSKLIGPSSSLTTNTIMDGMGHIIESELTSDPSGTDYTVTTYDGMARPYIVYNPTRCNPPTTNCGESAWGRTTRYYDALGRTTVLVPPDGTIPTGSACATNDVCTTYSGNSATVTDQVGKTREAFTDALGRLTEVIEGATYQTNYLYDALDDLTSVSQGGSRQRTFTYNSLAELTSSTNPEVNSLSGSNSVNYVYDANGNVVTKTDSRPITVTNSYDVLNRILTSAYSNGDVTLSFTYDGALCQGAPACYNIGHRTVMKDGGGFESWAYDQMGRVLNQDRHTNNIALNSNYAYNLDGLPLTITYPSGRTLSYGYNTAAQLTSALDSTNGITYASNGIYTPAGNLAAVEYSTLYNSTWIYDSRLQPCWIYTTATPNVALPTNSACTAAATPGTILDLKYNFNLGTGDTGSVYGITNDRDTTRSQTFQYDAYNRLSTAQSTTACGSNCWSQTFTYDQWANLLSVAATGTAPPLNTLTINGNNHIISPTSFSYDAVGNQTSDATSTYAWYASNELKSSYGVTYSYDGDGNRVMKSSGKIYWYNAGGQVLDESDASGNITDEYVYFGKKRVAHRAVSSNNIYYYAGDMLNSSRTIANSTGTACYDADFYPFGGEHDYVNTCAPNYKFTAKERDSESSNDYLGGRYYSSTASRFVSPDPVLIMNQRTIDPQQWNMYTYVRNNPLKLVDTNGKWPATIHNDIIDRAFPGLSEHQRSVLKTASANMDQCLLCQTEANAYKHSMKDPHETDAKAKQDTHDFIHREETAAQSDLKGTPASPADINDKSLSAFGDAAHTIADGTSPMHVDAQGNPLPWDPYSYSEVQAHEAGEETIDADEMARAVAGLRQAFLATYGQQAYQIAISNPSATPQKK